MEKIFKTHKDFKDRIKSLEARGKDINAYVSKEFKKSNGKAWNYRDKAFIKWLRDQGCSYSEIQEYVNKSKSTIAYHLKT